MHILLRDSAFPQADGTRLFAIRVIIPRASAVPRQQFIVARQFDDDADARQFWQTVGNVESKGQFIVVLFSGHRKAQCVKTAVHPVLCEPVSETLVVVRRGAEDLSADVRYQLYEIRCKRLAF